MNAVDVTLLVFVLTLAAAFGARRLRTPTPVVLAAAGIAAGVAWRHVPGLPPVVVPPDLVLVLFLPPLLASAAYMVPLGAFRRNLVPIGTLAVGLVLVTMAGVGATAHFAAGLPWAVALVFGAVVAPPDTVAATTVAGQTGLRHRLVVVLEGEGLVNDAVSIVAYELALRAATTGQFSWADTGLALLRAVPTGVALGLALGWATATLHRRLDDVTLEAGLSLLAPYVTYELADRLGASGVLAVVTLGFVLQRRLVRDASPVVRLSSSIVWGAVRFVSTALVFFLLGLLLGEVASRGAALGHLSGALVLAGAAAAGAVVAIRMAWMYVVPTVTQVLAGPAYTTRPNWRERTVLGWSGMRGVVSLALALALPALPGPAGDARPVVIGLTLAVIVGTLLLQGVTLLPLIRRLGVGDPERDARDERRVRARARRAGLAALARAGEGARDDGAAHPVHAFGRLVANGALGIAGAGAAPVGDGEAAAPVRAALDAQLRVVTGMRDGGRIGGALAERLAAEVDVDALRVRGDASRLTGAEDD